jgi:hypothetical protein
MSGVTAARALRAISRSIHGPYSGCTRTPRRLRRWPAARIARRSAVTPSPCLARITWRTGPDSLSRPHEGCAAENSRYCWSDGNAGQRRFASPILPRLSPCIGISLLRRPKKKRPKPPVGGMSRAVSTSFFPPERLLSRCRSRPACCSSSRSRCSRP